MVIMEDDYNDGDNEDDDDDCDHDKNVDNAIKVDSINDDNDYDDG